ncbi:TniQ family protein [Derxia gummosa]|uniref:TniQ family protein n=1 Tax=Derxia gummosa DSM 723 TaxID=1121388 RepID=A0AC36KK88_9BURK
MAEWAFQLRPYADELLSSFLARTAHGHGSMAGAFCRFHLRDSWFFTRDVDRGMVVSQHALLARLAGLSPQEISALTLRSWVDALTPARYRATVSPAVVPWINAAGIVQARRRYRSLAFCPACLEERPVALRQWRLSFHVWCSVHGRPLQDGCPQCGAAFVPHLARATLLRCHACSCALSEGIQASHGNQLEVAALQAQMDQWLTAAANGDTESRDQLDALHVLTSVILFGHSGQALRTTMNEFRSEAPRKSRLEFLGMTERECAMSCLARVLNGWPNSFRQLAQLTGLTQRSFARLGAVASSGSWLGDEVAKLRPGSKRAHARRDECMVDLEGRETSEHGNWRAERAQLLMRRAIKRGH